MFRSVKGTGFTIALATVAAIAALAVGLMFVAVANSLQEKFAAIQGRPGITEDA